jgi:hypothetical protein
LNQIVTAEPLVVAVVKVGTDDVDSYVREYPDPNYVPDV